MTEKKMTLNTEQKQLIEDNYCLVKDFIKKSIKSNKIPDGLVDDLISEMNWKFCISALKFEKERGFKFSTYAYHNFDYGMQKVLAKKDNKSRDIDLSPQFDKEKSRS
jgi:DNA-directed RNA polymerase specialized sigma subunit